MNSTSVLCSFRSLRIDVAQFARRLFTLCARSRLIAPVAALVVVEAAVVLGSGGSAALTANWVHSDLEGCVVDHCFPCSFGLSVPRMKACISSRVRVRSFVDVYRLEDFFVGGLKFLERDGSVTTTTHHGAAIASVLASYLGTSR